MKCDHCGGELDHATRIQVIADLKSYYPGPDGKAMLDRVAMRRYWAMCSYECVDTWWNAPDLKVFSPVSNPGDRTEHLWPTDLNLRLVVGTLGPDGEDTLIDDSKHADPSELNSYWQGAGQS